MKNENVEIIADLIAPEDAKLMIEPKISCNDCYGRGYLLWLEGDGYKLSSTRTGFKEKVPNNKRHSRPCHCVFRNAKFRLDKKSPIKIKNTSANWQK